jgi:hypothetical protein
VKPPAVHSNPQNDNQENRFMQPAVPSFPPETREAKAGKKRTARGWVHRAARAPSKNSHSFFCSLLKKPGFNAVGFRKSRGKTSYRLELVLYQVVGGHAAAQAHPRAHLLLFGLVHLARLLALARVFQRAILLLVTGKASKQL